MIQLRLSNNRTYSLWSGSDSIISTLKNSQVSKNLFRWQGLAHFKDGHSRTQIAKFLKVSRNSVNGVQSFLNEGLEGLQEKPEQKDCHS
ncbi:helix-turn-helix domain-containing protein [Vibrio parahaemolyticus]|uniref:helix-turn-helix domain-containing protein n=1 Tax=Vibrio parahaemolyticus TaxID=670 RepID=UPI003C12FB29